MLTVSGAQVLPGLAETLAAHPGWPVRGVPSLDSAPPDVVRFSLSPGLRGSRALEGYAAILNNETAATPCSGGSGDD